MTALLFLCGCISIVTTVGIVAVLVFEAIGFFTEVSLVDFFGDTQWTPLFAEKHFGIWALISGTFLTSLVALTLAVPIGILIAIYLSEFASPRARAWVKPLLEIFAGIPTIIYGYFALLFITPALQQIFPSMASFNALSPGLVMGVMILPMVASLSEDALYGLPRSLREGAYALGATKLQMVFGVLVPAATGGITAAVMLGMARAVGETMIVAIAAGQQTSASINLLEPAQTMTAYIVQVSMGDTPHGTLEYRTIFAVGLTLFLMTLVLNALSMRIKKISDKAYQL